MNEGQDYRVTYRRVRNRPAWTETRVLRYKGLYDGLVGFEVPDAQEVGEGARRRSRVRLTLDQIANIEEV